MSSLVESWFRHSVFSILLIIPSVIPPANAADINNYSSQYECRAGGPNCNVDVAALSARPCDQTITPDMSWDKIDWSRNTICIAPGDHTGKQTLLIPPTANGTASNYKVLRYTGNNEVPWRQGTNQTKLFQLAIQGNYWLVDRLTFPGLSGQHFMQRIQFRATKTKNLHDVIINRVLIEGGGKGAIYGGIGQTDSADSTSDYQSLTIQNSVLRNSGPFGANAEAIGIDMAVGLDNRDSGYHIVNNEIYDWVSHPIQIGHNLGTQIPGIVVENNDLYVTPALYATVPGGQQAIAESPLSVKVKGTQQFPVRILHNRMWGARVTDLTQCCNGESGNNITMYGNNDYVLIQNNVLADSQLGLSNSASRNSYIGNIFYDLQRHFLGYPDRPDRPYNSIVFNTWDDGSYRHAYELYLNTIIGAQQESFSALDEADVDVRCNATISSGPKHSGISPTNTIADRNVFYGSTSFGTTSIDNPISLRTNSFYNTGTILRTADMASCKNASDSACFLYKVIQPGTSTGATSYCTTLGCTTTDNTLKVQAIRGPYVVYRQLQTNPKPYVIPYASVHTSAEEAASCPSTMATRTGIGINDDNGWNGILAVDLNGRSRTGTAGALQAASTPPPPPPTETPYPGPNPASIPAANLNVATIEAENFDEGGEGVAYHDVDTTSCGSPSGYRPTTVGLEAAGNASNGYLIGCARKDEYLKYMVDVTRAGNYVLEVPVASKGLGGSFHIEFNGVNKTGAISIPDTGDWNIWRTLKLPAVALSTGKQIMRIVMETNGGTTGAVGNLDYVRLTAQAVPVSPYPGPNPAAIPGTVEAEYFDNGSEGVSYHEVDTWDPDNYFRVSPVDIEANSTASKGNALVITRGGEWLNYAVNVAAAGNYILEVGVAAASDNGSFHIEFAGANKTGSIVVPNTGNWYNWRNVARIVNLAAGPQTLRLVMEANGSSGAVANFDYIRLRRAEPYPTATPAALPGLVEAEDFDNGGPEVSYHETDTWNVANNYRTVSEVDIEPTAGANNSYAVVITHAGEWLNYTVNVTAAGTYNLDIRVASKGSSGKFHVEVDGLDKTGSITIPNTGDWANWQTLTVPVSLAAGPQIMRIVMDADDPLTKAVGNFDFIRVR
ncbi:MAG: carbohydrate-binding protein [Gammaproteobacteria bacterium]|nr:carbohydrate-binding protein [Gammaproteobacteria bacterium]